MERLNLDSRQRHRHQEHRQALMFHNVRVGAQATDIVGDMCAGGEHLLAVNDPIIAIAHGAGLRGIHIGPGGRLAKAQA